MKVLLAGYNIDYETIRELREARPETGHLTPETISAAYARISRNPLPVNELRQAARREVESARKSNRNIVFGMGHSSIAEHAVFNIDVLGVSRLLVEEIEKFRLCSYTEKSQRYVLLRDDFVVPEEIRRARLDESFTGMVRSQNAFYHTLYKKLLPYVLRKNRAMAREPAQRSTLEGWAKEDARYILSLATETQLGMTLNARNLELMLRRSAAHPLEEARRYGHKLFEATGDIAPSLVRYTEATEYDSRTRETLREKVRDMFAVEIRKTGKERTPKAASLIHVTPDADNRLIASLLHSSSSLPMKKCMALAGAMKSRDKKEIIRAALRHMRPYDPALREFENVDLHFELVVSASCFAQLKRHRMATIVCQAYEPDLGVTVPPAVTDVGMESAFREVIRRTEALYERIRRVDPVAAPYILTNAHRKRVSIKLNARELYHMARLRTDRYAQWDIREVTGRMLALGRKAMPLTLMMATGKDLFASHYEHCFRDDRS
ncbi:MAG TPA: FAD-dependent thymidylate synthase [Syntrophales bacterium]|nr:FAD-dependent thymidylate synthase [Syntrophales bacterium]HOX93378.1 FAD-dependent thymidylate synthase [Syntrophales bacterium]HPI56077.1 FAD-dependent thymidylate synthase [Syntrophales bacterium]HPN24033.1 FAD-dependent thymidylate synthase [Syntrophales bacterium]HQM28312.1 FAD-dependent thymidylate synthase [Syntrophales bacterium]